MPLRFPIITRSFCAAIRLFLAQLFLARLFFPASFPRLLSLLLP